MPLPFPTQHAHRTMSSGYSRTAAVAALSLLLGVAALGAPRQARAQASSGTSLDAAKPDSALGLSLERAFGELLLYDFGALPDGTQFRLEVTFRPGEVHWKQLWDGKAETDPTKVVQLDANRMLASWPEENGYFIALYADFLRGETSFCSTNNPGVAAASSCLTGIISRVTSPQRP